MVYLAADRCSDSAPASVPGDVSAPKTGSGKAAEQARDQQDRQQEFGIDRHRHSKIGRDRQAGKFVGEDEILGRVDLKPGAIDNLGFIRAPEDEAQRNACEQQRDAFDDATRQHVGDPRPE